MFPGMSVSVCRHHSTVVQKNEGAKVDCQPAPGFIRSDDPLQMIKNDLSQRLQDLQANNYVELCSSIPCSYIA
jgi:hypothetical protein